MAIYIDADKLKQDLVDLYDFAKWDPREIHFSLFDMTANIDGEPTADVAPVVHSHWKEYEDYSGAVYPECARCGLVWWLDEGTAEDNEMYYCPKCGAKMDEKEGQ